jgi:hypothetical protein
VNYCSRVHSSITIMIITFFTGPPPPSLAALHAPFHQPPTSHCTLSAFFRGRTHRPSPGVPSDFCKGWCRPTTLRSTPLACALTISLRFPLQESAAVASRCALRSLLTSERPHLVGPADLYWRLFMASPERGPNGSLPLWLNMRLLYDPPSSLSPSSKATVQSSSIAAFSLLPPLSPISCSTHSTHGRRKILNVVHLQSGGSYQGRSSNNPYTREFLKKKYDEVVSKIPPTTFYADTTTYHVDRIKRLFKE